MNNSIVSAARTVIKVWGLPRSCTNWVFWLLRDNWNTTRVLSNVLGWKHAIPPLFDTTGNHWGPKAPSPEQISDYDDILFARSSGQVKQVYCVKHPIAWVKSYKNYRRAPLISLIQRWNTATSCYLASLSAKSTALINYHTLLEDTENRLDQLGNELALPPREAPYTIRKKRMSRGGDLTEGSSAELAANFNPSTYTDMDYTSLFEAKDYDILMENIDWSLWEQVEKVG